MQSIGERIKSVRTSKNLTMESFGERIGVSAASVSRLESGINTPARSTVRSICREFSVNEEWLETGAGAMHPPESTLLQLSAVFKAVAKDPDDSFRQAVFLGLARLDPEEWEALEKIVEKIIGPK